MSEETSTPKPKAKGGKTDQPVENIVDPDAYPERSYEDAMSDAERERREARGGRRK